MLLNCLSCFGMTDMYEIKTLTLSEYYLRLEAYQLQQISKQRELAQQAWFTEAVKATKGSSKNPKPKYEKFEDFFDSTGMENKIRKTFDPDFEPQVESKQELEKERALLFNKRSQEWISKHNEKGG